MQKRLRVLIIEDSKDDAELLIETLRDGGYAPTLDLVDTAEGLSEKLTTGRYDLVISDHKMRGFDAIEALSIYRSFGADAPFIIYSNVIGEEEAAEAMRNGANDYVLKRNPQRLLPAISRELKEAQRRREQRSLDVKFQVAATLFRRVFESPLMGLYFSNDEGTLLEANSAFLEMVGYTQKEVATGRITTRFLTPAPHAELDQQASDEVSRSEVSAPYKKEFVRKDGRHVSVLVASARVEHPVYKLVTYAIDLSNAHFRLSE